MGELCRRCLVSGDRKILELFYPRREMRSVRYDLWWNSEPRKTCLVSDFITPTLGRFGKVRDPPLIKDTSRIREVSSTQQGEKLQREAATSIKSYVEICSSSEVLQGFAHGPRSCQATTHAPTKVNRPISALQMVRVTEQLGIPCSFLGLQYRYYSQSKTGAHSQK